MSSSNSIFAMEQISDVLVVVPQGDLFQFRYNDLRDAYNDVYARISQPDVHHLLFDFANLTHFGSAFIGTLIRLAKKTRGDGGQAVLCCLSEQMTEMLQTLMLLENVDTDFFWAKYATREEALAAIHADE